MTSATMLADRAVALTRDGDLFRLAFRFDPALVEQVKSLPYARFDSDTRSWTAAVCTQSVQALRRMFYAGLLDAAPDSLLAPGEEPAPCVMAELRAGRGKRPYAVYFAIHGDRLFDKVRSVSGAQWDRRGHCLTFPAQSGPALSDFVTRGLIADPGKLLAPAATTVMFDTRSGHFVVSGPDERAAIAFDRNFPEADVVSRWQARGLDVAFMDSFTEEMYRGELARRGPGFRPEGLQARLYDFQAQHVAVALERSGYAVFDAPGLGKTVTGIAVGMELLGRGQVSRVIAVVPAAVRSQWASEIERYAGTEPGQVVVVTGDPATRRAAYEASAGQPWLVVHYDILSKDKKLLRPLFAGALVIADEAHRLKNYRAARTAAALDLSRAAARRLALSGTPIERNPAEFYQVLSGFTCPGVLGAPDEFNSRYREKTKFGYEGARNLRELRVRSMCYFGRNTKEQVASHLPPLVVQQVALDPDVNFAAALRRAHREAADEIRRAALDRLTARPGQGTLLNPDLADEVKTGADMTAVGMLRLMCSSPRLVAESDAAAAEAMRDAGLIPEEDGPKLDELRVMLAELRAVREQRLIDMEERGLDAATPEMVQGERLVVFSFSKRMVNLVSARLKEDGINHVVYTGDSSDAERDEAVRVFTDPSSDVLAFVATDAAAEGLNLGRCCSTLVNLDLPWSPSALEQRSNRIHRLDGTASRYRVVNLILADTMEIGVARLLGQRADIADAIFGENSARTRSVGRRGSKSIIEEVLSQYQAGRGPAPAARPRKAHASRPGPAREEPRPAIPPERQLRLL